MKVLQNEFQTVADILFRYKVSTETVLGRTSASFEIKQCVP
jgi:hypothetical protein